MVLAVLALVDTTLIASLLLILLFSGYRNFVARPLTCPLARER
ncbi:YqhA family protein [Alkalilimnicola ehrlichii]